MPSPEELAREKIDALLEQCGWDLQKRSTINLSASRGVANREALLKDRDEVDYLLFVDSKAIGTLEAKPEGYTLTGVEEQSGKYRKRFLDILSSRISSSSENAAHTTSWTSSNLTTIAVSTTWAKVKSMATFADAHEVLLGRLMVGRKIGDELRVVDVADHKVRESARKMGAPADLEALFDKVAR